MVTTGKIGAMRLLAPLGPSGAFSEGEPRAEADEGGAAFVALRLPGGVRLRGLAQVAVVQAADFWKLHDPPSRGEFDGPGIWCVLGE